MPKGSAAAAGCVCALSPHTLLLRPSRSLQPVEVELVFSRAEAAEELGRLAMARAGPAVPGLAHVLGLLHARAPELPGRLQATRAAFRRQAYQAAVAGLFEPLADDGGGR